MGESFLVQVTVVAGPPEEMQVKVLVAKSYSNEVIVGKPTPHDNIGFHQFGGNLTLPTSIDSSIHGHILQT